MAKKTVKEREQLKLLKLDAAKVPASVEAPSAEPVEKEEIRDQHIRSGVISFACGYSLAPIELVEATLTNKKGVQDGKDRGMAPNAHRTVRHAVYSLAFDVNYNTAKKTKTKFRDVLINLHFLPMIYYLNPSRIRNAANVTLRAYYLFEHENRYGSKSLADLVALVEPVPLVKHPTSWKDYKTFQGTVDFIGIKTYDLKEAFEQARKLPEVLGISPEKLPTTYRGRYSGVVVFEANNANLNGDPDLEGSPRMFSDGYGWLTDVSVKRKLRDAIEDCVNNTDDDYCKATLDIFGIPKEQLAILEQRGRRVSEVFKEIAENGIDAFLDHYIDARVFGNCLMKENEDRKKKREENSNASGAQSE